MDVLWCWIEHHPGLAAWIQAIGSLLAIAIAIFVPWYQAWKQRNQELDNLKVGLCIEISQGIEFLKTQVSTSSTKLPPGAMMKPISPSLRVFDANCGKLGLLKQDIAREVFTYYQKIDALQRYVEAGQILPVETFAAQVLDREGEAQRAIAALENH